LQDDGEGYGEEHDGMDEDELLDEEDLVDGASEGSDDAARMGIQSMQVGSAPYSPLPALSCEFDSGFWTRCHCACCAPCSAPLQTFAHENEAVHDRCGHVVKVHEVELAGDGGSDGDGGAMPTPAQTAAAGAAAAAAVFAETAEAVAAQAAAAQPAAARQPTAAASSGQTARRCGLMAHGHLLPQCVPCK
jgi:hypothetical protein